MAESLAKLTKVLMNLSKFNVRISIRFWIYRWTWKSDLCFAPTSVKTKQCVQVLEIHKKNNICYLNFQAYKKWLKSNDISSEEPLPGLEHLNHDQLFYLNFAQVWCGSTRPEALRSKLKTAVHAPGKYRYFFIFHLHFGRAISPVQVLGTKKFP